RRSTRRHRRLPLRTGSGRQHRNGGRGLHARLDGSADRDRTGPAEHGRRTPAGGAGRAAGVRGVAGAGVGGMSAQAGADLTIRNGVVVTPTGLVRGGLSATGGVITQIGADHLLPAGATDVDAGGKYLLPGIIDPHVHLGIGPGAGSEKLVQDFESESADAAAGGVTTMITTTQFGKESRGEVAEAAIATGNQHSLVDYRLTAVVTTREHLTEAADLVKLGLRSFKFFLGYKGEQAEGFGMNADGISWDFFYQACEALGEAGAKAFPTVHAEDPWVRDFLTERLRGSGKNGLLQRWLETSPNILEPMQIYPAA